MLAAQGVSAGQSEQGVLGQNMFGGSQTFKARMTSYVTWAKELVL